MMSDGGQESSPRVPVKETLERKKSEEVTALVSNLSSAPVETRKECVRSLKSTVSEDPTLVEPALPVCEALLTDNERSVRLTTAKLFVTAAEADPEAVVPMVPTLADRLADNEEFYYVRARSAEALGYVAFDHPDTVASPEVLADLRIGLSFDNSEVKEKLAKALEYVALGNPDRLRHQVANLAEHLDDENELVRYHLCTALVLISCCSPENLAGARDALAARLTDENAYVRGRAAEALGLLARTETTDSVLPKIELGSIADEEEPFAAKRARFALGATTEGDESANSSDGIGTVEAIRGTTQEIVDDIAAPDADDECSHCGLVLPEAGPPICPRCGAPY